MSRLQAGRRMTKMQRPTGGTYTEATSPIPR